MTKKITKIECEPFQIKMHWKCLGNYPYYNRTCEPLVKVKFVVILHTDLSSTTNGKLPFAHCPGGYFYQPRFYVLQKKNMTLRTCI